MGNRRGLDPAPLGSGDSTPRGGGTRRPPRRRQANTEGLMRFVQAARRAAAERGSGGLGNVGSVTGLAGQYLGGVGRGATGPQHNTLQNLVNDYMKAMGAPPSAPTMSPSLMDVNALTSQFGSYRDQLSQQADLNRRNLESNAAAGVQDTRMVNDAAVQRLAAYEQMRQADGARQAAAIQGANAAAAAAMQAQGMDGATTATTQATANEANAAAAYQNAQSQQSVDGMQAQNDIEFARRQSEDSTQARNATQQLDGNLFAAMAALNAQEQKARQEAAQYNAQATAQANEANYNGQMANYEAQAALLDRNSQLPSALLEMASSMGALNTPRRDSVYQELLNAPSGSLRAKTLTALLETGDPVEAEKEATNALKDINKERKKAGLTLYSGRDIRQWIDNWFYTDGSMTNDGYRQLQQMRPGG